MKKWNLNNKYVGWGITAFLVISASLGVYYLMFHGSRLIANISRVFNILMPVMFGLVIGYLLAPVLDYFEIRIVTPLCDKLHIKKSNRRAQLIRLFCILITLALFFTLIYELIYMLIAQIVPSVINIANNFDTYVDNITNWANKLLEDNPMLRDNAIKLINNYSAEIDEWINTTVITKTSNLLKVVSGGVLTTIKVLWNLIIGIIISVYVMLNKEKFAGQFKKIVFALNDINSANIIINNVKFTHRTFGGFIGGKVLDSFIIGLLCFTGTYFMHTPYAALISVIIGLTNIIPFFGPFLGAIPSILLIFIVDPMHPLNCVYFAIFVLILQQVDGNLIGPWILGDSTGLSSFWVIFSITFFGGLWSVGGMVVGVPLFAVIYAAIKSAVEMKLSKKNLPTETDDYTYVCAIDEKGLHTYVPEGKQNRKNKEVYQFGQQFISDSTEIITGDFMTQYTLQKPEKKKKQKDDVDEKASIKESVDKSKKKKG
ncbi:MAG: AI-2E family transporter [Acetatifactor sp.]|nr:AI-2E family transporter [Acetatifactor sp.]